MAGLQVWRLYDGAICQEWQGLWLLELDDWASLWDLWSMWETQRRFVDVSGIQTAGWFRVERPLALLSLCCRG